MASNIFNLLKYQLIKRIYPTPRWIHVKIGYGKYDVKPDDYSENLMALALKKSFPKNKSKS